MRRVSTYRISHGIPMSHTSTSSACRASCPEGLVAGDGGLGYYMVQTQNLLRTKEAFAALIILTLMGLLFYLAMPATGAMAREVAEAYGSQVGNHPVGSGPFVIDQWKRSDKITLAANRDYHQRWQGQRLPIVDKEGVLVGAIGVSGSSVENDHQVAAAGVKVVGVSDLPEHPWRT